MYRKKAAGIKKNGELTALSVKNRTSIKLSSLFFYKNLFLYEREAVKKMPESREHAMDIPETEERRRSFVLNTARDDENNICFSFNVRQYNIAYSVVHVQLRF